METQNKHEIVDSVEKLEALLARVREAEKIFATYSQEQVDKIFKAAAIAANKARQIFICNPQASPVRVYFSHIIRLGFS